MSGQILVSKLDLVRLKQEFWQGNACKISFIRIHKYDKCRF